MPPAADSNRAASLENTEREGEEREEGEEMGGGEGGGEENAEKNKAPNIIIGSGLFLP